MNIGTSTKAFLLADKYYFKVSHIIMPLHEYLEQKRRTNINQLNATGACHICGSKCRSNSEFYNAVEEENDGYYTNKDSMVRPASLNVAPMITCSCFGNDPSDPNYWPYSVRRQQHRHTFLSLDNKKISLLTNIIQSNIKL